MDRSCRSGSPVSVSGCRHFESSLVECFIYGLRISHTAFAISRPRELRARYRSRSRGSHSEVPNSRQLDVCGNLAEVGIAGSDPVVHTFELRSCGTMAACSSPWSSARGAAQCTGPVAIPGSACTLPDGG
jgi:hypothetical protein